MASMSLSPGLSNPNHRRPTAKSLNLKDLSLYHSNGRWSFVSGWLRLKDELLLVKRGFWMEAWVLIPLLTHPLKS